jgi:hypothetical protein
LADQRIKRLLTKSAHRFLVTVYHGGNMSHIGSKEAVERQYDTPEDLSIPDFLRRPSIPATATLLPELPARSSMSGANVQVVNLMALQSGLGA